ncbi:uncharacterized protein RBU33_013860 isoform 1-T2 [Hipposideros larvatus]
MSCRGRAEGGGRRREEGPAGRGGGGRRRGAGGRPPSLRPPLLFPSRPPSKPLSPRRPQARGASCQAGHARRGEGAAALRRWAGGGEGGGPAAAGSGHREGGRGHPAAAGRRVSPSTPFSGPPRGPAPGPRAALGHGREVAQGWRGGGGWEGGVRPALGEARGGGGLAEDRREGVRAQRKSPEGREDGGGGGSPSPPSRGVTLARPPAALGSREGGRNASPQALISPPSPVPGTRGQRPPGRGPSSGFGAAHAGVRGRVQRLLPVLRQAGSRLALGLSFLHGGIGTRSGPEQSGLPLGPRLGPSCWSNLHP